jgi:ABC-type phosphate transport system permease subunit
MRLAVFTKFLYPDHKEAPRTNHPMVGSNEETRAKTGGTRGAVTLAALFASLLLLVWQSLPVVSHGGGDLLFGNDWYYPRQVFGALSMIYGTAVVSSIALVLAAPLALGAAIFTAEYLPPGLRMTAKSGIEMLAGVPSVVYGLIGVLFLREWVYQGLEAFDPISGDSLRTFVSTRKLIYQRGLKNRAHAREPQTARDMQGEDQPSPYWPDGKSDGE